MSYTKSSIITYEDHLDIHYVKLPLKYHDSDILDVTPKEQFNLNVAKSGGLLQIDSIVDMVSYTILQGDKTIKLFPIVNSNSLLFTYQQIHIRFPNKILAHSITYVQDQIIVDLIDKSFLFINLVINIKDFIKGNKLVLDKFDSWCHICIPYSFELTNSIPYYISHLNSNNLIVSLSNGQLIQFDRKRVLSDFIVTHLVEHAPFTLFGGLFGNNKTIKEINGISKDLVVDSILLDDVLFTLTISKYLKIWNLSSGRLINSVYIGGEFDNWLTLIPNKYIQLVEFNNTKYITLFINDESEGYKFKMYQLDTLTELPQYEFVANINSEINWFIQDFIVEQQKNTLKYHVLFKSNVYSNLLTYDLSLETGSVLQIVKSITNEDIEEVSPHHLTDYYITKIFNSGFYNELIINTSLALLNPHLSQPITNNSKSTIIKAFSGNNELQYWFKFDSLCQEFLKLSQEALAISLYQNSILSLQVNSLGIFHPIHYYQQELPDKLTQIFNKFKQIISQKSLYRLHKHLLTIELNSDHISQLYQTFISDKLNESEIQEIISTLESIPDVVSTIQSLIDTSSFELINDDYVNPISSFVKLDTISTFESIKSAHELILLNLIILFIICQTNDEIISMMNSIISILKNYELIELIFTTNFHNPDKISDLSQSLFWNGIVDNYPKLNNLIVSHKLNDSFDYLISIMSDHKFVLNIVIELINKDQAKFLQEDLLSKLNQKNVMDKLLIGLIHLLNGNANEVYATFQDFTPFKQLERLNINDKFNELANTIYNNNESEYFHTLAKLCQQQSTTQFLEIALKFELSAINHSSSTDYYLNVFDMALSISDYDVVSQSLNHITNIKPYLTNLILKLISERKISIIFPPNNSIYIRHFKLIDEILSSLANTESDMVSALKLYEYLYSWRLISIRELGDKRGAIESLYQFITRFKDSNVDTKWKLKILEIYMIVLNVLKVFKEDERWLLKYEAIRKVVQLDEVKLEYLIWLKQLQNDSEEDLGVVYNL